MSANPAAEKYDRPGAYIEEAVQKSVNLLDRVQWIMALNPEPIAQEFIPMCHDVTDYTVLDIQDTGDRYDDIHAHMRGLQWAWGIAHATGFMRRVPVRFADLQPEPGLEAKQRYELLRSGLKDFLLNSRSVCIAAEQCAEIIDPREEYYRLTRRGLVMGLYMAELGFREVRTHLILRSIQEATERTIFQEIMTASGMGEAESSAS